MWLWAIYILPGSVHIFSCSRLGRPIVEINQSLTDKWMWKLGLKLELRPHNSFSENIYFKFFGIVSLQCGVKVKRSTLGRKKTDYKTVIFPSMDTDKMFGLYYNFRIVDSRFPLWTISVPHWTIVAKRFDPDPYSPCLSCPRSQIRKVHFTPKIDFKTVFFSSWKDVHRKTFLIVL